MQEPILVTGLCIMAFVILQILGRPSAEVVLLMLIFSRVNGSSNKLQRRYQQTVTESSALWSMREMIDEAEADAETMTTGESPTLDRGVDLRDVRVELDGASVLDSLSLSIPAGNERGFLRRPQTL
jgi:hypothetical protein